MTNEEFIQSIALPGEEWKLAPGFEGRYLASSYGRIVSLSFPYKQGKYVCYKKQRLKKQNMVSGYLATNVIRNGKSREYSVHRIIAETFIPNPDKLPCVNHKDEDKTNNRADNLEWCTHKYNSNYGTQPLARKKYSLQELKYRKPVIQLTKDNAYVATHRSIYHAAKDTGIAKASIKRCLKGKYKTAGGFIWLLSSDYESLISISKNSLQNRLSSGGS